MNKHSYTSWLRFALCSACLLLAACSLSTPPKEPPTFPHTITYSGETLAAIAGWYTGDFNNWKALAVANPNIKPNKMRIGQVVLIPENLLKRTDALPNKFLKTAPKISPAEEKKQLKKIQESAPATAPTVQAEEATNTPEATPASEATSSSNAVVSATATPLVVPTSTPDPVDSSVESILMEPTKAAALNPEEKAKSDLIDEMLNK